MVGTGEGAGLALGTGDVVGDSVGPGAEVWVGVRCGRANEDCGGSEIGYHNFTFTIDKVVVFA